MKLRYYSYHNLIVRLTLLLSLLTAICACASNKPETINLMPAPDIYAQAIVDPFEDLDHLNNAPYHGILYATNRAPGKDSGQLYKNDRGNVLRMGIGRIEVGDGEFTWEMARKISLLKNRSTEYPLKVTDVKEIGVLDRSLSEFTDPNAIPSDPEEPRKRFLDLVNKKLAISRHKDIYIYVHGYKVGFDNPLLVATELWHYLAYDGVFIAYAWPSTPGKTLAYTSDLETAAFSAKFLRMLLEVLAEQSDAENIHIIGYSAGTRVVISSLYQLALIHKKESTEKIHRDLRIGHTILVGSDFDRQLLGLYLTDGLLNIPETLTVYASKSDKAMGVSRFVFRRERLGSMWEEGDLSSKGIEYLKNQRHLRVINVTEAEGADTGNGHAYFRKSPWVSSDILMTLMYDLEPEKRGLVKMENDPVWTFPPTYAKEIKAILKQVRPELFTQPSQLSQ